MVAQILALKEGQPWARNRKGKTMCRLLLEVELIREVSRGEFRAEMHLLPVTLFPWIADQARVLRNGSSVTIATRSGQIREQL